MCRPTQPPITSKVLARLCVSCTSAGPSRGLVPPRGGAPLCYGMPGPAPLPQAGDAPPLRAELFWASRDLASRASGSGARCSCIRRHGSACVSRHRLHDRSMSFAHEGRASWGAVPRKCRRRAATPSVVVVGLPPSLCSAVGFQTLRGMVRRRQASRFEMLRPSLGNVALRIHEVSLPRPELAVSPGCVIPQLGYKHLEGKSITAFTRWRSFHIELESTPCIGRHKFDWNLTCHESSFIELACPCLR